MRRCERESRATFNCTTKGVIKDDRGSRELCEGLGRPVKGEVSLGAGGGVGRGPCRWNFSHAAPRALSTPLN